MTSAERVTTVAVGDEVVMDRDERGFIVAAPCDDKNHGHWYCATHREGFSNQLQKDSHIFDGEHRLAWICHEHGLEVP